LVRVICWLPAVLAVGGVTWLPAAYVAQYAGGGLGGEHAGPESGLTAVFGLVAVVGLAVVVGLTRRGTPPGRADRNRCRVGVPIVTGFATPVTCVPAARARMCSLSC
jgi:hypothetical protein